MLVMFVIYKTNDNKIINQKDSFYKPLMPNLRYYSLLSIWFWLIKYLPIFQHLRSSFLLDIKVEYKAWKGNHFK